QPVHRQQRAGADEAQGGNRDHAVGSAGKISCSRTAGMRSAMIRRILLAALMASPAQAQAPVMSNGTNMPPNFYPAPSCEKPDKKRLGGAPGVQDQDAMRAYNYKVKIFNER